MRLIDADALIAEYDRLHVGPPGRARKLMVDALTVEPERKTGQWITNETIINCSKCKHCSWSRRSFEHVVRSFNFCPNCGADMRGEQDGKNT